jgi:hypothetical protein
MSLIGWRTQLAACSILAGLMGAVPSAPSVAPIIAFFLFAVHAIQFGSKLC